MKLLLNQRRVSVNSGGKPNRRAGLALLAAVFLAAFCVLCVWRAGLVPASAAPVPASGARPQTLPVPAGLPAGLRPTDAPERILPLFLNLPYREDGAVDENGRYTLFASPGVRLETPGLNCSGFVLEASRFLLRTNIPLEAATRDRLGDSGPASPHGEDWDFGWDILLNISEGFPRALLLPGGKNMDPAKATGFAPRGFDLHAPETRGELLGRLRPGYLYLVSFNKDVTRPGYAMQHYHVGLILPTASGQAWLYQTTGAAGKVNRRDLNSREGWASFARAFANTGGVRKHVLVVEVKLP